MNAIRDYGTARRFSEMERWASRLNTLSVLPFLSGSRDIQLAKAHGACNAILHYGKARRMEDIARWYLVLMTIDRSNSYDPDILEQIVLGKYMALTFSIGLQAHPPVDKDQPDDNTALAGEFAAALLNTIHRAPWLTLTIAGNSVFVVEICSVLALDLKVVDSSLSDLAQSISEKERDALSRFENWENSSREVLLGLWADRQWLPLWGKLLWPRLAEIGETDWVADALGDPWMTDEDRNILRKPDALDYLRNLRQVSQ